MIYSTTTFNEITEEDVVAVNSGDLVEVVVNDVTPTEGSGEERSKFEDLDGRLDPVAHQANHAVAPRGRIRRYAAAAWRGVKRAGRLVVCCGC